MQSFTSPDNAWGLLMMWSCNVPRSWGVEDLRKIVSEVGPGVTGVELVKVCTFLLCYAFHFHNKL